jgi:hypothetical protein
MNDSISIALAPGRPCRSVRATLAVLVIAVLALVVTPPAGASAAQIDVTSTRDLAGPACPSSNRCTLRAALAAAVSGDVVSVPAGTYDLTQGELELCPGVSLDGAGARTTIVRPAAGEASRVIEVTAVGPPCGGQQETSEITGLTITGGDPPADVADQGGGVLVDPDATVTITEATITGNRAGGPDTDGGELGGATGGGVDVEDNGTLTLLRSTVSGNTVGDPTASSTTGGAGAGIYAAGTVSVSDSTIAANHSDYEGAGIFIGPGATVNLRNATLDANVAGGGWSGGNVYLDGADGAIGSGAASPGLLGGILGASSVATGSGDDGNATLTVENSIIADGVAATLPDCATSDPQTTEIRSLGNNLSSGTSCDLMAPGDIQNTSPELGPLGDHGGPTDTLAPAAGSPAIDAGADAACPATDQRGVPRPQGAHCDIGAVEYEAGAPGAHTTPAAAPRITGLRVRPRAFRPATDGPSVITGPHPGDSSAPGALIGFTASRAGSITFTVLRERSGVLQAGVCRSTALAPRAVAHSRGCVRLVAIGSFRHAAAAGAGELRFSGRIAGRALSGPYVLRATSRSADGASGPPASASFTAL